MEGVRRSPIYNPMHLPMSTAASRNGDTYLTTEAMSKSAALRPVEIPLVAMDPILGDMGQPVEVDVKNGPPKWLYYVGALASVGSLLYLVFHKR